MFFENFKVTARQRRFNCYFCNFRARVDRKNRLFITGTNGFYRRFGLIKLRNERRGCTSCLEVNCTRYEFRASLNENRLQYSAGTGRKGECESYVATTRYTYIVLAIRTVSFGESCMRRNFVHKR